MEINMEPTNHPFRKENHLNLNQTSIDYCFPCSFSREKEATNDKNSYKPLKKIPSPKQVTCGRSRVVSCALLHHGMGTRRADRAHGGGWLDLKAG